MQLKEEVSSLVPLARSSLDRAVKKTPPKTSLQTLAFMRGFCVCWRYQKNISEVEANPVNIQENRSV